MSLSEIYKEFLIQTNLEKLSSLWMLFFCVAINWNFSYDSSLQS